jgi:hypothetical protein
MNWARQKSQYFGLNKRPKNLEESRKHLRKRLKKPFFWFQLSFAYKEAFLWYNLNKQNWND